MVQRAQTVSEDPHRRERNFHSFPSYQVCYVQCSYQECSCIAFLTYSNLVFYQVCSVFLLLISSLFMSCIPDKLCSGLVFLIKCVQVLFSNQVCSVFFPNLVCAGLVFQQSVCWSCFPNKCVQVLFTYDECSFIVLIPSMFNIHVLSVSLSHSPMLSFSWG